MFDFTGYMEWIAEMLLEVQHDPEAKERKFFRISSVMNLDEMVEHFTNAGSPCIMVEDNRIGRFMDANSDNYLDIQSYSFLVLKYCKVMDAKDRETAKNDTLALVKKIISRMKRDKRDDLTGGFTKSGLQNFDLNSVTYQTIGPIGDNYYGTLVQFSMLNPVNSEIAFKADDWMDRGYLLNSTTMFW